MIVSLIGAFIGALGLAGLSPTQAQTETEIGVQAAPLKAVQEGRFKPSLDDRRSDQEGLWEGPEGAEEQSLEEVEEQLNQLRNLRALRRERLRRIVTERRKTEKQLGLLQKRVEEKTRELRVFEGDLAEHQRVVNSLDEELRRVKHNAESLRQQARRRLKRLYKDFRIHHALPLRRVRSAARGLRQARYEAVVAKADLELFQNYHATQRALRALSGRISSRTADIEALRQRAAHNAAELAELRNERENLLIALLDERHAIIANLQFLDSAVDSAAGRLSAAMKRRQQQDEEEERRRASWRVKALRPSQTRGGQTRGEWAPPAAGQPSMPQERALVEAPRRQAVLDFAALKGKLPWPVEGRLLPPPSTSQPTVQFAARPKRGVAGAGNPRRRRIGVVAEAGAPINSVERGEVLFADLLAGYGKLLIIHHGSSYYTLYGQVGEILVEVGDQVERLQRVALADQKPTEKPRAVYFELRYHGLPENPLDWLTRKPAS